MVEGLSIRVLLPLDLTELEDSSTELLGSPALCGNVTGLGRLAGAGRLSLEPPAAGTDVQPWQLIIPRFQTTKGPFQHESFKKAWY